LAARRSSRYLLVAGPDTDWQPVDVRDVLAFRREVLPGRSPAKQAEVLYLVLFALGIIAVVFWGVWGAVGAFFSDLARPYHLIWGPPALLLLILGILRYNTLQGFVVFSEPDCAHLLTAPVPRSGLVGPRLRNVSIALALGGGIAGLLAGLASKGADESGRMLGLGAAAGAAFGLILVATGWQVQRAPRVSLWVARLTLPALAVAIALAVAKSLGGAAASVAHWSGPWGWAALSAIGGSWAFRLAGLLLLWACAVAGVIGLVRTAGSAPLETFEQRARTRSQVIAGAYAFDTRSILQATRQRVPALSRLRLRIRVPRRPSLALVWRDSVSLLRSPLRFGWGIILAGTAAVLLAGGKGTGTAWGGGLLLYLAASALLEPLRRETDSPIASQLLLPWSYGRVLWLHCLLPAMLVAAIGFVGALVGFAAGYVTGLRLIIFVVLWIPVSLAVVLAAAMSGRRGGRAPQDMILLTAGDTMGISVLGIFIWMFIWAILAILLAGAGMGKVLEAVSAAGTVVAFAGFGVLAAILQRSLLRSGR
jgi:hypothetical protein